MSALSFDRHGRHEINTSGWLILLKSAISGWLIAVAAWDHIEGRIPNWLVLPVMLIGLVYQIYASISGRNWAILGVVVAWVAIFSLWQARVYGGGDAKLLMGLFALFPNYRFLIVFCVATLAVSIPLLVYEIAKKHIRRWRIGKDTAHELACHEQGDGDRDDSALPSASAWRITYRPYAWVFALPGVIYTWTLF